MTSNEIRSAQRANRGSNPSPFDVVALRDGIDAWVAKRRNFRSGFAIGGYHWKDELSGKTETANIQYRPSAGTYTVSGAQCAGVSVWYTLNYSETFDSLNEALEHIDDISGGQVSVIADFFSNGETEAE